MIILLHHIPKFKSNIWMDVGLSVSNNRRYINITKIHDKIGVQTSASLPAFHAYTGSDFTSSLCKKGKIRPFEKLLNDRDAQLAFIDLSSSQSPKAKTRKSLENFTAQLYGSKSHQPSLNDFRFKCFEKGFRPKQTAKNKLQDLSGVNASSLPPCQAELEMHLKRTSFVAKMWTNAHLASIMVHPSEKDGWKLMAQKHEPIWHGGERLSPNLEIHDSTNEEEDDGNTI